MKILVLHFTHPEGYPPAFNAINCMGESAELVTVLTVDTLPTLGNYPSSVNFDLLEGGHDRFKFVKRSKFKKMKTYFSFIFKLYKYLKKDKYDLLVLYDDLPFLFYSITRFLVKSKIKVWYHNHDVYPLSNFKKYRINWFAAYSVQKYFNSIDFFSLPALERKKMFPLVRFKGDVFFIPNYPSKKIIKKREDSDLLENKTELKLVYTGSPSIKNGFEELINVMGERVNGKKITLTIIGEIGVGYRDELIILAKNNNCLSQIAFLGWLPHVEMTNFLKQFDVGWAVYKPIDLSVATAGTSSNKIYEFLANGLPILVFDNEHHRGHLAEVKSCKFTTLIKENILAQLSEFDLNLKQLKIESRLSFESSFQFDKAFNASFQEIKRKLNE